MQKEEGDLAIRTKAFALQIIRLFGALPKTTEAQVIGKQLLRAGTSVGANYREAYRGRSKAEFVLNVAIVCAKSRKRATGWTCSLTLRSSRQRNLSRCETNGATGVSDMAGKAARVCGRAQREAAEIQCSELIAIL
jgi:hypothetical protein